MAQATGGRAASPTPFGSLRRVPPVAGLSGQSPVVVPCACFPQITGSKMLRTAAICRRLLASTIVYGVGYAAEGSRSTVLWVEQP
jgi:hypothetical protein